MRAEDLETLFDRYGAAPELRRAVRGLLVVRVVRREDGSEEQSLVVRESAETLPPNTLDLPPPGSEAETVLLGPDETALGTAAGTLLLDGRTLPPVEEGYAPPPRAPAERYEDLGVIGFGGMGEVRRVRDRELDRVLAMKIVRPELASKPLALARFIEEAHRTARLEHPGVVPVHDAGRLPDGRYFFTMKEIRGRTLTEIIEAVHAASGAGRWGTTEDGWTLRRLVDAFRRVCETMAYVHARGVVHRDLKPDNIMIGAHGEVLVLDWGLARAAGVPSTDDAVTGLVLDRNRSARRTMHGSIAGTPQFMAPEQASGEVDRIGPASDVWALGGILWQMIDGRPPYRGEGAHEVLAQVREAPPPLPRGPAPVAEELLAICGKAMAFEPENRFRDAATLSVRVAEWLEGVRQREQALAIVADAQAELPRARALRARAAACRTEALRAAETVRTWDSAEKKRAGWALEDEAESLAADADLAELGVVRLLQAALTQTDLPEAHALLAELYRERHAEAEERRDAREARRYEALLRAHDDGRHAAWLRGDGAVSLTTDPPGARVTLHRYALRDRRLQAEPVGALPVTPFSRAPLAMGSYLLVLAAEGCEPVRLPVHVGRAAHEDHTRPGTSEPWPIRLPRSGELGPDDVYVPAGWFVAGGDAEAPTGLARQRVWVDAFAIKRTPVTNAEYIAFLDDLVASGREADALRWVPRERSGEAGKLGAMIYGRTPQGGFELRADTDGDAWLPDYPVLLVDWSCARAYADWYAERTHLPWRLPGELEWEKAARGVDGRFFPWGDFVDASWTNLRGSRSGRPLPAPVGTHPIDESPYGVLDLAGNARDWCGDDFTALPPVQGDVAVPPLRPSEQAARSSRGGAWSNTDQGARACARRGPLVQEYRNEAIGFRLARRIPADAG